MAAEKTKAALDDLAAEAKAVESGESVAAAEAGRITLTLTGRQASAEITVLPLLEWGDEAVECLTRQDIRGWARAVLDADNLRKWVACAPNILQGRDFFARWDAGMGESAAS